MYKDNLFVMNKRLFDTLFNYFIEKLAKKYAESY